MVSQLQWAVLEPELEQGFDTSGRDPCEVEFGVNDIVVGFRVNRYRCRRKLLGKKDDEWKLKDEGLLEGDMMGDGGETDNSNDSNEGSGARGGSEIEHEAAEIAEEVDASNDLDRSIGEDECWVGH